MMVDIRIDYIKMMSLRYRLAMYMTIEDTMRGLRIFHSPRIQSWNEHCGSSKVYGDLRKQKYTKNMFQLSKFKEGLINIIQMI